MDRKETKIITIASIKGGVGKSTTSLFFSKILSNKGFKVLLIDFDPQASLSSYFFDILSKNNIDIKSKNSYEYLKSNFNFKEDEFKVDNNLYLLPSYLTLNKFNEESIPLKDNKLEKKLSLLKNNFDYIIIDSAPSLGSVLNNSLIVCDYLVIPITSDLWAVESIDLLENRIKELDRDNLKINILLNNINKNLEVDKKVISLIKENFFDHLIGIIPKREQVKKTLFFKENFNFNNELIREFEKALNKLISL